MHAYRLPFPVTVPVLVGAGALSVLAGLAIAAGHGPIVIAAGVGATALAAAGRWRRGLAIGLLLLGVLNGIPFVDVSEISTGTALNAVDVLLVALLAGLAVCNLEPGAHRRSPRAWKFAWAWAAALIGWWAVIWIWSLAQGIPILEAWLYGRDFLYFALLLPMMIGALRGPNDLEAIGATLGAAALLYAIAQHLGEFADFDTSNFIHATFEGGVIGGFTRYFADMGHLEVAAVPFGAGLVLFGTSRLARIAGLTLFVVVGTAVALQFTRASYSALVIAFAVVTALWATRSGQAGRRLRRAAVLGTGALVAIFIVFELADLSIDSGSAPGAVIERASSGVQQVQQGTGTYQQRREVYDDMFDTLGANWPVGLGFLDPNVHYVSGVPNGAIRNSDVGLMNAVMTMGVVGLVLIILPPVAITVMSVGAASAPLPYPWLSYGASVFLLESVLSSPSLITLFTISGLALTAVICAAALHALEAPATGATEPRRGGDPPGF